MDIFSGRNLNTQFGAKRNLISVQVNELLLIILGC